MISPEWWTSPLNKHLYEGKHYVVQGNFEDKYRNSYLYFRYFHKTVSQYITSTGLGLTILAQLILELSAILLLQDLRFWD